MKIKKRYYFGSFILIFVIVLYFIDREFLMKKRVMRHELWDYESGYHYRANGELRDILYTNHITSFKKDTMVFTLKQGENYVQDTLVLKWQYFGTMKVLDPETGKTATFGMKGANWIDYLFK